MRRRALAVASILIAAPLVASAAVAPAMATAPTTVTIDDFGVFTVPAGVTSVTVELTGGDGGTATTSSLTGFTAIGQGGRGGVVSGTIAVEPGDELFVRVGTAGSGIVIESAPVDILPGGTGAGDGGEGWVSGGGSSSIALNGVPVAGAPGGGGGAAIWTTLSDNLFATNGGDGGADGGDVIDGTNILEGGAAGGNPTNPTTDGQDANFSSGNDLKLANGAGGAGWPGGGSASNGFGDGDPLPIYLAGGGGGVALVTEQLLDPVVGVKDSAAGRDGSVAVTYTAAAELDAELAATGPATVAGGLALAALLLGAGALVAVNGRRSATARR